jgi:hypothetical protein
MWTLKAESSETTRASASALALFVIEGVGVRKMKHAGDVSSTAVEKGAIDSSSGLILRPARGSAPGISPSWGPYGNPPAS